MPNPLDDHIAALQAEAAQAHLAELQHEALMTDPTPEGELRRTQAMAQADLEGDATYNRAIQQGQPRSAATRMAHRMNARAARGLPTPADYSRMQAAKPEAKPVGAIQHGLQGAALLAGRGVELLRHPETPEMTEAFNVAQEAQEIERGQLSPVGRFGSKMVEMGANIGLMATPGGIPARAPMVMTTMALPVAAEGTAAGMHPVASFARGVGHAAVMEAAGGMRVPGLSPAPMLPAGARTAAQRTAPAIAREIVRSTPAVAAAGAVKGVAMQAGTQALDATMRRIDPNTPESEAHYGEGAADFAVLDTAMHVLTRGKAGARMGDAFRQRLAEVRAQRETNPLNLDRMMSWSANPAEARAISDTNIDTGSVVSGYNAERLAALGGRPADSPVARSLRDAMHRANAEQAIRMEADRNAERMANEQTADAEMRVFNTDRARENQAALEDFAARERLAQGEQARDEALARRIRMSQEGDAAHARVDANAAARAEHQQVVDALYAQRTHEDPAGPSQSGMVRAAEGRIDDPNVDPTGPTAEAAARTRMAQDLRAQRPDTRPPEDRPVFGAELFHTPEVQRARGHFDRVMADPNADRTARAYARQGLSDAVSAAREASRAPVDEAVSGPISGEHPAAPEALGPGEPVADRPAPPRLQPPTRDDRLAQNVRDFREGRISAEEAVSRRKAIDTEAEAAARPPVDAERPYHAEPPAPEKPEVLPARQEVQPAPAAPVGGRGGELPRPEVEAEPPIIDPPPGSPLAGIGHGTLAEGKASPGMAAHAPELATTASDIETGPKRLVRAPTGVGEKVAAFVKRLGAAFGAFQGNKVKAMPMMAEVTHRTMTPEERGRVTTTYDLFGGSGSAGLMHRLLSFTSKGKHVINEWNQARLEKIKLVQTTTPAEVKRLARTLELDGATVEGAMRNAVMSAHSGGGVSGRLAAAIMSRYVDAASGKIKPGYDPRAVAVAQLFADHMERKGVGLWNSIQSGVYNYVANAHKLAQEAKAKGVEIEYRNDDAYSMDVEKGNHVHVLADPPYFATSGYNGGKLVGTDFYHRTGQLVRRMRDNGNHLLYTDEAWWGKDVPKGKEWADGQNIREGARILRDIHNEATTFDTHRVGNRTESLVTVHPDKARLTPRGEEPPAPRTPPAEPGLEGPGASAERPTGATGAAKPGGESPWAEAVRRGLDAGVTGRKYEGGADTAPLKGVTIRKINDRQYEMVDPDGAAIPITIEAPRKPAEVDARSWFDSIVNQDWPDGRGRVGVEGVRKLVFAAAPGAKTEKLALARKINNAETFATLVPIEVQHRLFKESPVGGGYQGGKIVMHVSNKGETEAVIARNMNEEAWHAITDMLTPKADKDAAIAEMRRRGFERATDMSADRDANPEGHRLFMEALYGYARKWSPEGAKAAAGVRRAAQERGFRATLQRIFDRIASFFGVVKRAAAYSPDGLDLIVGKIAGGEYKAPLESKPADTAAEAHAVQPIAGLETKRAQGVADMVTQKRNAEAAERYRAIDETADRMRQHLDRHFGGDAREAVKGIFRTGRISSVEDLHLLKAAMDKVGAEDGLSAKGALFLAKAADIITRSESMWGQLLAHGQRVRTPMQNLTWLRAMALAPNASSAATLSRLVDRIEKAVREGDSTSLERHVAERERILGNIAQANMKVIQALKDKYGIDLNGPDAINYAVNPGVAKDVASLINSVKGGVRKDRKFANFMRAAMLTDLLQTQTQQAISNTAMALFLRNPVANVVRSGRAGLSSSAAWLTGRVYREALANGIRSFKGQTVEEQRAGKGWGVPRNVDVQAKLNVDLGRMDDPIESHPGEMSGPLLSPATMLSFRPMAFFDGMAQKFSSQIMEAELMHRAVREAGGSNAEAHAAAIEVLRGERKVADDMAAEAVIKSLDTTFQDLAIAEKNKPGQRQDARSAVNQVLNLQRFLDSSIPLWKADPETGERPHLPIGSMTLPFVRTSAAIVRAAVRANPALQPGYMTARAAAGRYEGVAGKDQWAVDRTYLTMGALGAAALIAAMKSGAVQVMGTEPDDARRRVINSSDRSKDMLPEYTLRALGYDIPFARVEPLSTITASVANAVNELEKGGGLLRAAAAGGDAYIRVGGGLAFFSAVDNLRSVFDPPQGFNAENKPDVSDKAAEYALKLTTQAWPAIVRNMTQDEVYRQYPIIKDMGSPIDNPGGWLDSFKKMATFWSQRTGVGHAASKVGLTESDRTPPRFSHTGGVMRDEKPAGSDLLRRVVKGGFGRTPAPTGGDFMSAFDQYRQSLPDGLKGKLQMPYVAREFREWKTDFRLSPEEYAAVQQEVGKMQAPVLDALSRVIPNLRPDEHSVMLLNKYIQRYTNQIESAVRKKVLADRKELEKTSIR